MSKINKSGFAWPLVLVVVAAAVIAVGFFLLKPKPPQSTPIPQQTPTPQTTSPTQTDETADWKVYTNTQGNFSIKYPPNFKYREVTHTNSDKRDLVIESDNLEIGEVIKGGLLSISVDEYADNLNTLEKIVTFENNTNKSQGLNTVNSDTKIDGYRAVRFKYEPGVWGEITQQEVPEIPKNFSEERIITVKQNRDYLITLQYDVDDVQTLKILDQILSTFRFE